jgi:hypothetical protein
MKGRRAKKNIYNAERSAVAVASVLKVALNAVAARSLLDDEDSPMRSDVDNAISPSSYVASSSVGRALMLMDESNLARVDDRAGDGRCRCGCDAKNVVAAMAVDDEVVED